MKRPERPFTLSLKESYLQHLSVIPLILSNTPFPIESFFTQLSIVSSASQDEKEKTARDPHLIEKNSLREIHDGSVVQKSQLR